jgi:hypothetical protein
MKSIIYIFLITISSCSLGLNKELDKQVAEELILNLDKTGTIDSLLLHESNAHRIMEHNGYYLLVVNSFNGDFNGYIYTKKGTNNFDSLKFEHFYILDSEEEKNNWTKVYGKW